MRKPKARKIVPFQTMAQVKEARASPNGEIIMLSIRMPEPDYERLRRAAYRRRMPLSVLARRLIADGLKVNRMALLPLLVCLVLTSLIVSPQLASAHQDDYCRLVGKGCDSLRLVPPSLTPKPIKPPRYKPSPFGIRYAAIATIATATPAIATATPEVTS